MAAIRVTVKQCELCAAPEVFNRRSMAVSYIKRTQNASVFYQIAPPRVSCTRTTWLIHPPFGRSCNTRIYIYSNRTHFSLSQISSKIASFLKGPQAINLLWCWTHVDKHPTVYGHNCLSACTVVHGDRTKTGLCRYFFDFLYSMYC